MRAIINATVCAAAAVLMAGTDVGAQVWGRAAATPREGVCFYEDIDYRGQYFCTNANAANPLVGLNDRISSIRVFGGAEVTVFQERDFQGASQTFAADIRDLRRQGWNDSITSVRVQPAGSAWTSRASTTAAPANGACFYESPNFRGQYFCSRQGDSIEMVPAGINDRISSIRLLGTAALVVYRDRDFGGTSQWFDASEPDLRESGWDDTISSYRIGARDALANRGRSYDYPPDYGQRGGAAGDSAQADGIVEWRGRVDERVQLLIRGRAIEERTLSGTGFPEGRAGFSSALPAAPVRVGVRVLAGRGRVGVVQQPARQNGYTAVIEIYDPERGAQEYRLLMNWR